MVEFKSNYCEDLKVLNSIKTINSDYSSNEDSVEDQAQDLSLHHLRHRNDSELKTENPNSFNFVSRVAEAFKVSTTSFKICFHLKTNKSIIFLKLKANELHTISNDIHNCPDCGKRYSTSSNLARHRQTHRSVTDKKARKCPHCDKVYVSMPAYSMHVRTHSQVQRIFKLFYKL